MKPPRHVYLSGGMEYAANEGRDWRRAMESWLVSTLGWSVFNPNQKSDEYLAAHHPGVDIRGLKHSDPGQYKKIVEALVELDCSEIAERTDIVICYWDESAMRGAGTKGEVTIARHFGKPVYMVTRMPLDEIPGWVLACTTRVFASFEELQRFLLSA